MNYKIGFLTLVIAFLVGCGSSATPTSAPPHSPPSTTAVNPTVETTPPIQLPTSSTAVTTPLATTDEFTLTLVPTNLSVHQGWSNAVTITITRASTFTGDVQVTLSSQTDGITADTLTLPNGWSNGILTISASSTATVRGPINVTVTGASGNIKKPVTLSLTVKPQAPTAQELIQAAFDASRIDYGTSLVYRAYALFGDPRLPEEFWGSGSSGEDNELFFEFQHVGNTLPEEVQTKMRPFLVRPTHRDSIFNQARSDSHRVAGVAFMETQLCADNMSSANSWLSERSSKYPIRVWARCTSKDDLEAQLAVAVTLQLAEKMWQPMTSLMGEPMLDEGTPDQGGDSAIDIYLLSPFTTVNRDGKDEFIPSGAVAAAIESPPYIGMASSGYMLLSRTRLNGSCYNNHVVHEFFHILQDSHNKRVNIQWFVEGSARWAEWYFLEKPLACPIHGDFEKNFQPSEKSLLAHKHDAYIWPFFMQQERDANAIADAWRAMETAQDFEQALKAIDAQLPFSEHFRDFALRNLNKTFDGQNPIGTRYVNLDPQFPDGKEPKIEPEYYGRLWTKEEPADQITVSIPLLKAKYYHLIAPTNIGSWDFDFSQLQSKDTLTIDGVVKTKKGKWEVLKLPAKTDVELCDVEELYLVLSNHAMEMSKKITGNFGVRPLKEVHSDTWSGTITVNEDQEDTVSFTDTLSRVGTYQWTEKRLATIRVECSLATSTRQFNKVFHEDWRRESDQHIEVYSDDKIQKGAGVHMIETPLAILLNSDGSYEISLKEEGLVQGTWEAKQHHSVTCKTPDPFICIPGSQDPTWGPYPASYSIPISRTIVGKVSPNNRNVLSGRTTEVSPYGSNGTRTVTIDWNLTRDSP